MADLLVQNRFVVKGDHQKAAMTKSVYPEARIAFVIDHRNNTLFEVLPPRPAKLATDTIALRKQAYDSWIWV